MDGNLKTLLEMIEAYPKMPVVPMVDGEIVTDDYGWYMGQIVQVSRDAFIIDRSGRVIFRSEDDIYDALENALSGEAFDALPDSEEAFMDAYEALPWKQAILIWISMP